MVDYERTDESREGVAARLREAINESGVSHQEIADEAGVSIQAVTGWKSTGKISGANVAIVARKTGYSTDWILTGTGPKFRGGRSKEGNTQDKWTEVSPGPEVKGEVPVISWVQAGHPREAVDLHHPGEAEEWVETTAPVNRHTFALWVANDSMMPTFPPGIRIIIEPDMDAEIGDYVVARDAEGHTTFKKLVQEGGDFYLKPLNSQYPVKEMKGWEIVGVVREAVWRFR